MNTPPRGTEWCPDSLWGLGDLLKKYAAHYVRLGRDISWCLQTYEAAKDVPGGLSQTQRIGVQGRLQKIETLCSDLGMTIAGPMVRRRVQKIPQEVQEFKVLIEAVNGELDERQLLYLAPDRVGFHNDESVLSSDAKKHFPSAFFEMKTASTCYAVGLGTACVLHTMRAAEVGLWSLGRELGVSFPHHPIEMGQWQNILEQIECKIKEMKKLPKSTQKDSDLNFYSQLASDFHYFKDGWRVRAAHAREVFDDPQALKILTRTKDFFNVLATRLKEKTTP